MKTRSVSKVLAIVLAMTLFFSSVGVTSVSAASIDTSAITGVVDKISSNITVQRAVTSLVQTILKSAINLLTGKLKDNPKFETADQYKSENFYTGTGKFKTTAAAGAKWNLGYANASLIPADVTNGNYYIGGYIMAENGFSNKVEGVIDDMKVRTIALSDGSGSGTVLFATIDCIGITNNDIRQIRALLADFAKANNIVSINISSTHCHSCLDTEGLWTDELVKTLVNVSDNTTGNGDKMQQGTNAEYMQFLYNKVAATLKTAYADMKPGTLTYANKDIGSQYFENKNRQSSDTLMTDLNRFVFTPDDKTAEPTMILNMAAHPDCAGLPTSDNSGREVSGDYVYYVGKLLGDAGYNFMFFNGAICGIYMNRGASNDGLDLQYRYQQSERYGYEIARMALSMTLTQSQILKNELLCNSAEVNANSGNANYTIWYKDWTPVTETVVTPYLNVALKEVEVPVTNQILISAGKLNLANFTVIKHDDGTYSTHTEVGYMEMGNSFKTVFLPGEICQDLVVGGTSLTAARSQSGKDFGYPTVAQIFGEGTKCFGLTNDAIGYVVPDTDYALALVNGHYQESISLGEGTASALILGLEQLAKDIGK